MNRVAIYGGSFNPPTLAHAAVVRQVLESSEFDEFLVVPTFQHAYAKSLAPFHHRMRMCEIAFAGISPKVHVSALDKVIISEPRGSMFSLCEQFQAISPKSLSVIIGQDQAEEILGKWHRGADLVNMVNLNVIPRGNGSPWLHDKHPWLSEHTVHYRLPAELREVSSTRARQALSSGSPTEPYLDTGVALYCAEHNIYNAEDTIHA